MEMFTIGELRHYLNKYKSKESDIDAWGHKLTQGTGRAICRLCGQKIKKGEKDFSFKIDLHGGGGWTGTRAHFHHDEFKKLEKIFKKVYIETYDFENENIGLICIRKPIKQRISILDYYSGTLQALFDELTWFIPRDKKENQKVA